MRKTKSINPEKASAKLGLKISDTIDNLGETIGTPSYMYNKYDLMVFIAAMIDELNEIDYRGLNDPETDELTWGVRRIIEICKALKEKK